MIITAGRFKGKRVKCPLNAGIRPTSSKTRMGIFNVLSSNFDFNGSIRLLELFAGTGLFSFEALSRGIDTALLVDKSRESVLCIKKNIMDFGLSDTARVIKSDALDFIKKNDLSGYSLVFMDPPYALDIAQDLLAVLEGKISAKTVLVIETNKAFAEQDSRIGSYHVVRVKDWGEAFVTFIVKI